MKKITLKRIFIYAIVVLGFVLSILFVNHNYSFYDRPIAKVIKTKLVDKTEITDIHHNKDYLFTQQIEALLKNGEKKGELIHLTNKYSSSGAYDQQYHAGNELFVSINSNKKGNNEITGTILDVKRDKYILMIAWIFIFTLLIIGKKRGLFTVISLAVNALILTFSIDVYVKNPNISLILIAGISVFFFTIISLLLVNGFNEKTYAAIVSTIIGTFISLLITYFIMWLTSDNGLRYEEMQFLTRPYKFVFMAGLFIGSLGAVMDVSVTMASSIFALYESNNHLPAKVLQTSGMEIGKDVMGTITSILFFAYISGSIPMIILYLKNASPLGFTLSLNLSLELARALAGGIGIVLTIPISLYTSIFFINRKKARL
ncbi:YibE/F family protein [Bacillus benzoevorans]|uniref:Putative membrane protein n=1 Tax=Bacillus benzoevorans TaxID=1456 RepID=A0A7X0LW50_9BACI|nr:YibE/F family protein [Bacillus benzoevorans]MBB6446230.1 putative membrane protein [Bacillus benzoevorans]